MVVTRPLISQVSFIEPHSEVMLNLAGGKGFGVICGKDSQLLYKVDQLWMPKRTVYSLCLLWLSLRTEHPKIISVCSLQAVGWEYWLWSLRPDCEFHFYHNYWWDHRQAAVSPTASVSSSENRRESWVAERKNWEKKRKALWDFFKP